MTTGLIMGFVWSARLSLDQNKQTGVSRRTWYTTDHLAVRFVPKWQMCPAEVWGEMFMVLPMENMGIRREDGEERELKGWMSWCMRRERKRTTRWTYRGRERFIWNRRKGHSIFKICQKLLSNRTQICYETRDNNFVEHWTYPMACPQSSVEMIGILTVLIKT